MLRKKYLVLIALLVGLLFSSCFKVEETIATITVVNELGTPVPGAEVRLFNYGNADNGGAEPRFDTIQFTNGSGKASFNFSDFYEAGQSGFVVLDVEVIKGSLLGEGIIKIEEQTTTDETVVVD